MKPAPERVAWGAARILAREGVTARALLLRLAVDWPAPHRAGQHVELRLTAPDGYRASRAYSIASPPSRRGEIDLLIARAEDGEVSGFLHGAAAVGDAVEVRGPIGSPFSWAPGDGGPVLLAGAGVGVAPLLAMVRERAQAAPGVAMALLYAARTRAEAPYVGELEARARSEPGFELLLGVSREGAARRVDRASVDEALSRLPGPPRRCFVCGSGGFVEAATACLLGARIPPGAIRTERFG